MITSIKNFNPFLTVDQIEFRPITVVYSIDYHNEFMALSAELTKDSSDDLVVDYFSLVRPDPEIEYDLNCLMPILSAVESAYVDLIKDKGDLLARVNKIFGRLFEGLQIVSNEKRPGVYSLSTINKKGMKLPIQCHGSGVLNCLPLIIYMVQEFKQNRIATILEPTMSMHVMLQFHMARLFAESVEPNKKHFVMGTSSAKFAEGLIRMVELKELKKEDIMMYYMHQNDKGESSLEKIKMTQDDDGIDFPGDLMSKLWG